MVSDSFTRMLIGKGGYGYGAKPKPIRKAISKDLREKVWLKYMGNRTQGKCYCCKIKPIHYTDFFVGHNKSVFSGGNNHINNLKPICRSCNLGMKTKSIEWYKKKYYSKPSKKPKRKVARKKIRRQQDLFGFKQPRFPGF